MTAHATDPVSLEGPSEVTIPLSEYQQLQERVEWLNDLEEAGVDNWQGMEDAIRIRNERLGDDE